MNEWALIIHLYAGIFADTDSLSVTSVSGFSTKAACEVAGKASERLVAQTKKDIKWVCVQK